MVQQSIWIGITIAVFFVGTGVSYAIFSNTDNSSTLKMANQETFDQMMSQNPKMTANWMETMMGDEQFHNQVMDHMTKNPEQMNQWMETMMGDEQFHNQAMDYMAKNPEQMNQWMVKDPRHVEEMSTAMKENHDFMMEMMSVMMNDPALRLQMLGHMTESQEAMEMMNKMMGSEMMSGSMMESGMMEGDEAKIRELISVYQIALNNEEIEKIPTLYSDQAIFMPPDVPAINGVEEIGLTYEYLFSQFDFELEFDIKEVEISENSAYVVSNSEGTITLESSETEETSKNQEIFILIKEGDNWKISRYMFNSLS